MFSFERRKAHPRGQTMPFHLFGMLALLGIGFLIYNWSCVVRTQIAAQNDADAAAQLAVMPQTTQFNQLQLALYGSNVEEYRARSLLNALLLNVRGSGGCDTNPWSGGPRPSATAVNCEANYPLLRNAYFDSVSRYTNDVRLVEAAMNSLRFDQVSAARSIVAGLQQGCAQAGDCDATYVLAGFSSRPKLGTVDADAVAYAFSGSDHGANGQPDAALSPAIADVAVCVPVKHLLPSFLGKSFGPTYVVARAAATPIAVTQEWFEPGVDVDASTGKPYQPTESWGLYASSQSNGLDSDTVYFSGNIAQADPQTQQFHATIANVAGEFSAFVDWWNTATVHPLTLSVAERSALQQSLAAAGCSTS